MVEIDVVGARRSGFESNGLADDKGDGLGLPAPVSPIIWKCWDSLGIRMRSAYSLRVSHRLGSPAFTGLPS